jgi:RimJ/RimL family protein N-acetyltransferase
MDAFETARLQLTRMTAADVEQVAGVMERDRDHLQPWVLVPDGLRAYLAGLVGHFVRYVVRRGEVFVGVVGLVERGTGVIELSYWLAADQTGKGYASEATGILACHAFEDLRAERVTLRIHRDNEPSAQVARSLGFVRDEGDDAVTVWTLTRRRLQAWFELRLDARALGKVTIAAAGGALQVGGLGLAIAEVDGQALAIATADVGPDDSFSASAVLRRNTMISFGAYCVHQGRLVLRAIGRLGERTLRALLAEASSARAELRATPAAALFNGYAT